MDYKVYFIFLIVIFSVSCLFAQKENDVDLLRNTDFAKTQKNREVVYGFSDTPSGFLLYNPVYHILSGTMWVYQKLISPQLASDCLYHPSCSEYSKLLIRDFGIPKGIFCTADRLMRCNRISMSAVRQDDFNHNDGKIHETTERYFFK